MKQAQPFRSKENILGIFLNHTLSRWNAIHAGVRMLSALV